MRISSLSKRDDENTENNEWIHICQNLRGSRRSVSQTNETP